MDMKLDSTWWLTPHRDDFYAEMAKLAAEVNVGQFWEQIGGPHLGRGGSLGDFKELMRKHNIPKAAQRRFMRAAKTRYKSNRQDAARNAAREAAEAAARARRGSSGYSGSNPYSSYSTYDAGIGAAAAARKKDVFRAGVAAGGLGVAAGLGSGLYAAFGKQKEKPKDIPNKTLAQLSAVGSVAVPLSIMGAGLGSNFGTKGAIIGAGLGAAIGSTLGVVPGAMLDDSAKYIASKALRSKNLDKAEKKLKQEASRGAASFARSGLVPGATLGLPLGVIGASSGLAGIGSGMSAAAIGGLGSRYEATKAYDIFKKRRAELEKQKSNDDMPKAASVKEAVRSPYMLDQIGRSKSKVFKAVAPNPKYQVKSASEKRAMFPSAGMGVKGVQQAAKKLSDSQKIGVPVMETMKVKPLNKLGFSTSQYNSGPMSQPPAIYASHIPPFRNPQIKAGGPPSERGSSKEKKGFVVVPVRTSYPDGSFSGYGALGAAGGTLLGAAATLPLAMKIRSPELAAGLGLAGPAIGAAAGSEYAYRKGLKKWEARRRAKREDEASDVKEAAMIDELCKLNNVISPKGALTTAKKIGMPKVTAPPGPSIQQVAKPVGYGRPIAGATKTL